MADHSLYEQREEALKMLLEEVRLLLRNELDVRSTVPPPWLR
jgi:hypothetical protein